MKTTPRLFFLALILALTITLLHPGQVLAGADITVNTTDDLYSEAPLGFCSLRMAIVAANENRAVGSCIAGSPDSPDMIWLQSATTYSLYRSDTSGGDTYLGDLDITQSLTIKTVGAAKTTIKAEPTQLQDRIFHVKTTGTVVFSNIIIEGGTAIGADGVYNSGRGGGILNESGTVIIENSVITGNNGPTAGGGIENHPGTTMTIIGSTIQNNLSSYGGGIFNNGSISIRNSLIYNNSATINGGGFNSDQNTSKSVFTNVTVAANQAVEGGGIFNQGELEITNSTIANNTQSGSGSGAGVFVANTSIGFITNTIIARHTKNCSIAKAGFSKGYNLEDRNDCGFNAAGDQTSKDALLAADLALNDGYTLNYALLDNSPAINHGTNAYCPNNDQRGILFLRTDGACDIGAFEYGIEETILTLRFYLPSVKR